MASRFTNQKFFILLLLLTIVFGFLSFFLAVQISAQIEGDGLAKKESAGNPGSQPKHNWHSNVEVARKVIDRFEKLQSYSATFQMDIKEGRRSRSLSGRVYYQKPSKIRYEFDRPKGNLIVSDGKIMWFYVKRLNTVGKQELDLKKKKSSGSFVFRSSPLTGLRRLFRKYHYRFNTTEQPRIIDNHSFFVLDMEQREKIGGYEQIKLYIDAETYLVHKAEGDDGYGKKSKIVFSKVQQNPSLEGSLFQYQPDNGVSVVSNPLVHGK